ncbi:hypothetical protein [Peptostreptococcus porci]|nr:hypothetical protein [Peptostreptococcus porci]MDD7183068.1 hypothetical protein [Peptostreptococcus porci]MDY5964677.1 hypothetical protein [Peptostreptococcus porci]
MTVFPKSKDLFAKKRRLIQTVDGAHFNSKTANMSARLIERNIEKIELD